MSRSRLLVTGATGLIGSSLLAALRQQGLDAHGVARSAHGSGMHAADLRSASATGAVLGLVEPTTVVHLVGGHHPDPARLTELNAGTLSNVMEAAADLATVPMVIAVGSAAEYGEPADGVVSESSPTEPVSAYGRAKLAATSRAMLLSEAAGVPLCVVRPFNVVSPHLRADTALGNLRRQLLAQSGTRRIVRCGRLDIVRDFVPLDYVVEVLAGVAILPAPPTVLNVCSGTGILLEDVLHALAASLDASVTVEPVPELTAIPAPERIVGDSSLQAQLGFSCRPSPASLASVLLDSV